VNCINTGCFIPGKKKKSDYALFLIKVEIAE